MVRGAQVIMVSSFKVLQGLVASFVKISSGIDCQGGQVVEVVVVVR